MAGLVTTFS